MQYINYKTFTTAFNNSVQAIAQVNAKTFNNVIQLTKNSAESATSNWFKKAANLKTTEDITQAVKDIPDVLLEATGQTKQYVSEMIKLNSNYVQECKKLFEDYLQNSFSEKSTKVKSKTVPKKAKQPKAKKTTNTVRAKRK